ncbi:glycosyl hydrolase 115 family protein, partial [Anaerosporobacter sp.]|uniref:glycosyl hydrolase 115 family protein n=1 Tax=Anaerosporobacter sp. TaxID=1872529 RepID=UPI00286EC3FA
WRKAIGSQRHMKVIWNIGFRGQGDCPFWDNDPQYDTPESRGKLMSELIMLQYNMVKQYIPEAICCTNLYGETMELYNDGYLELPNDIIKIWADNGYGKMVTRRQNNHNPRIPSLPVREKENRHGVYYHVSFYDLQAANHITMLPNSLEFIRQELNELISHEVKDFWIINCSNVKPHVYLLDYIASAWKNGDIEVEEHREQYIGEYYGQQNVKLISQCFEDYPRYALPFGKHEDEHAGEQFSNHVMRILISQFMRNKHERTEDLLWATQAESLKEQIEWYKELCQNAYLGYEEYLKKSEEVAIKLFESERRLFEDSLLLQVKIHYFCFLGANKMCESLLAAYQGEFKKAFYYAGLAKEDYQKADRAMRDCEHGKWNRFYENECLTDVKQTAWVITGLMSYIRNLEDGPHYYQWQREFLYSEEDRKVMLIMNMENHLTDEEIFELMKEKWEF